MVEENQPLGQVLVNPDRLQPPCSYHCHFSGGRLGGFLNWATTRACFIAQSKHHGAEERGVVSWFLGFSYLSAYARQPARGPTMLAHLVARLAYVGLCWPILRAICPAWSYVGPAWGYVGLS